jgi:hypothetical protein
VASIFLGGGDPFNRPFPNPPRPDLSVGTVKPVSEAPDSPPDLLSWRANPPTCGSGAPPPPTRPDQPRPGQSWLRSQITCDAQQPRFSRCAGPLRADPLRQTGTQLPLQWPLPPRPSQWPAPPTFLCRHWGQMGSYKAVVECERASNMAGAATWQMQPVGAQRSITARTRSARTGNHWSRVGSRGQSSTARPRKCQKSLTSPRKCESGAGRGGVRKRPVSLNYLFNRSVFRRFFAKNTGFPIRYI